MLTIFGRFLNSHPLDSALADWENSSEVDKQAMAWNLRADHRVSESREKAFLIRHFHNPPNAHDLRRALDRHRKDVIGPAKLPEYVFAKLNKNNLVTGHHEAKNLINKDVELVNILDLNGLFKPFKWYRSEKLKRYLEIDYSAVLKQSRFDTWLNKKLYRQPVNTTENFVELCLEVLASYRDRCGPYQPTWASTWKDFEDLKDEGADCWVQKFGMAKWTPRWQVALRYSVAEAGTLVRPTQIDCGYYAYHFSSPPQATLSRGGHPMSLCSSIAPKLVPEYIHKQIHHTLGHWIKGGRLIGQTQSFPEDLMKLRTSHYDLCEREYGRQLKRWMPRPV